MYYSNKTFRYNAYKKEMKAQEFINKQVNKQTRVYTYKFGS